MLSLHLSYSDPPSWGVSSYQKRAKSNSGSQTESSKKAKSEKKPEKYYDFTTKITNQAILDRIFTFAPETIPSIRRCNKKMSVCFGQEQLFTRNNFTKRVALFCLAMSRLQSMPKQLAAQPPQTLPELCYLHEKHLLSIKIPGKHASLTLAESDKKELTAVAKEYIENAKFFIPFGNQMITVTKLAQVGLWTLNDQTFKLVDRFDIKGLGSSLCERANLSRKYLVLSTMSGEYDDEEINFAILKIEANKINRIKLKKKGADYSEAIMNLSNANDLVSNGKHIFACYKKSTDAFLSCYTIRDSNVETLWTTKVSSDAFDAIITLFINNTHLMVKLDNFFTLFHDTYEICSGKRVSHFENGFLLSSNLLHFEDAGLVTHLRDNIITIWDIHSGMTRSCKSSVPLSRLRITKFSGQEVELFAYHREKANKTWYSF